MEELIKEAEKVSSLDDAIVCAKANPIACVGGIAAAVAAGYVAKRTCKSAVALLPSLTTKHVPKFSTHIIKKSVHHLSGDSSLSIDLIIGNSTQVKDGKNKKRTVFYLNDRVYFRPRACHDDAQTSDFSEFMGYVDNWSVFRTCNPQPFADVTSLFTTQIRGRTPGLPGFNNMIPCVLQAPDGHVLIRAFTFRNEYHSVSVKSMLALCQRYELPTLAPEDIPILLFNTYDNAEDTCPEWKPSAELESEIPIIDSDARVLSHKEQAKAKRKAEICQSHALDEGAPPLHETEDSYLDDEPPPTSGLSFQEKLFILNPDRFHTCIAHERKIIGQLRKLGHFPKGHPFEKYDPPTQSYQLRFFPKCLNILDPRYREMQVAYAVEQRTGNPPGLTSKGSGTAPVREKSTAPILDYIVKQQKVASDAHSVVKPVVAMTTSPLEAYLAQQQKILSDNRAVKPTPQDTVPMIQSVNYSSLTMEQAATVCQSNLFDSGYVPRAEKMN